MKPPREFMRSLCRHPDGMVRCWADWALEYAGWRNLRHDIRKNSHWRKRYMGHLRRALGELK